MKLFSWQPVGHGPLSFFIVAEDEATARTIIDATIATMRRYDVEGWGTDAYQLFMAEPGEILTHRND